MEFRFLFHWHNQLHESGSVYDGDLFFEETASSVSVKTCPTTAESDG
jgi:hypothetical protein